MTIQGAEVQTLRVLKSKTMQRPVAPIRRQRGFTLIEVMVSVLILLVGLLGVVGMQMLSIQANQGAYFRSQAVLAASEILDAMRANPEAAASYVGIYPTVNASGDAAAPAAQTCREEVGGCTPQQIATQDRREWNNHFTDVYGLGDNFRPSIPNGEAVISAVGNQYTVQVRWRERQFDDGDAADGSNTRSSVQQVVTLNSVILP